MGKSFISVKKKVLIVFNICQLIKLLFMFMVFRLCQLWWIIVCRNLRV